MAVVRLFSPSVFTYLCGAKPADIIVGVDEVADVNVKRVLQKV